MVFKILTNKLPVDPPFYVGDLARLVKGKLKVRVPSQNQGLEQPVNLQESCRTDCLTKCAIPLRFLCFLPVSSSRLGINDRVANTKRVHSPISVL